ncbi:hypothetical protein jhhlp_001861 [Lomentospora prolificans]|uniref:Transcription factor domain-containing protein n=1 Tax=Lomentospora prolificans TaxID=41688 RepID=A0A2N3NCG1_9PEZI|nr:hypothetical protein jhhlp_001861 [Lomentospora prolificans]
MLARIDDDPAGNCRSENGIFSVFPCRSRSPSSGPGTPFNAPSQSSISAADRSGPHGSLLPYTSLSPSPRPPIIERPSNESLETYADASHPGVSLPSPADDSLNFHTPAEDHAFQIATPSDPAPGQNRLPTKGPTTSRASYPASAQPQSAGETLPVPVSWTARPRPPTHLDLLRMPGSEKRLIHHWVTFTSGKLVLLDEPHNPCRSLMLPMALRGLTSSSATSNADIATFHAICACAAFNLYELGGRTCEQDHVLALHHEEGAIRYLRNNLAQVDQHRDQSFAMAIMACITIEAISGHTRRWRMHVSGGIAYLSKLHSRGISSDFQSHMVSMAILCGCEVPSELKSFLERAEELELSFPYYGASSSFLRNIDRMNTLAACESLPAAHELDAFELQLYLGFPAARNAGLSKVHTLMLYHMAQAFYYATLVFFQRCVRRAAIETVQTIVERGVAQLEAIEEVAKGEAGSIMMWPALILAAECGTPELQARVLAWFRQKQKLGFRNLVVVRDMVKELWERREHGDVHVNWKDLVAEERFDVFRL